MLTSPVAQVLFLQQRFEPLCRPAVLLEYLGRSKRNLFGTQSASRFQCVVRSKQLQGCELLTASGTGVGLYSVMFNSLAGHPHFQTRTACFHDIGLHLQVPPPPLLPKSGPTRPLQSHLTQMGMITWVRFAASWISPEGFLQPILADRRRVTWDPSVSCFCFLLQTPSVAKRPPTVGISLLRPPCANGAHVLDALSPSRLYCVSRSCRAWNCPVSFMPSSSVAEERAGNLLLSSCNAGALRHCGLPAGRRSRTELPKIASHRSPLLHKAMRIQRPASCASLLCASSDAHAAPIGAVKEDIKSPCH